jgi:hypothetical protein
MRCCPGVGPAGTRVRTQTTPCASSWRTSLMPRWVTNRARNFTLPHVSWHIRVCVREPASRPAGRRKTRPTTQHSTARQTTAQHSTAQHSTQHGTARHGTARHGTAQHSTAQHGTARHSTARHGTARHGTAQHSTALRHGEWPARPQTNGTLASKLVSWLGEDAQLAKVRGGAVGHRHTACGLVVLLLSST